MHVFHHVVYKHIHAWCTSIYINIIADSDGLPWPLLPLRVSCSNHRKLVKTGLRITLVKTLDTVYGLIFNYIILIFTMVCNLSTTYRSFIMLTSVLRAQVNKSLLDMDAKLTTLSGIIYTLVLIVIVDDTTAGILIWCADALSMAKQTWKESLPLQATTNLIHMSEFSICRSVRLPACLPVCLSLGLSVCLSAGASPQTAVGLGATLATSLFSLFFKLIQEKMGLAAVAEPLRDLNENRFVK